MLQRIKDKALAKVTQIAINKQIEEYGEVQSLRLDSRVHSIDLKVMLEGELEALIVHINKYEISESNGSHQLEVHGITTSRKWINTLASTYLENRSFNIPSEYATMLKVVQ